jgi:hypothetical protein
MPPIPRLEHWSDIQFINWNEATRSNTTEVNTPHFPPKHILFFNIESHNLVIEQAVNSILLRRNASKSDYPCLSVDAASEDGLVLLGTGHGRAVSHLLFQHKNQFGIVRVGQVLI